ncbi:MAG TPA: hypothetical protein VL987_00410 [Cellvibrio sp.]|nr:hypothetical protein [Cellvibrio sp.]
MEQPLTNKQQFWREHVLAAQRSNLSYAKYAKEHDLSVQALYSWSTTLRRKGLLETVTSAFVELRADQVPSDPAPRLPVEARVRLANGVELELTALNEHTLRWLASL